MQKKCSQCQIVFPTEGELRVHLTSSHPSFSINVLAPTPIRPQPRPVVAPVATTPTPGDAPQLEDLRKSCLSCLLCSACKGFLSFYFWVFEFSNQLSPPLVLGVPLNGGRSHLCSHPFLDRLGFKIHITLRILICVDCRRAIFPQDLEGHIAVQHQSDKFSVDDKQVFQKLLQDHCIFQKPDQVLLPLDNGPPVELIPHYPGFKCGVQRCSYVARARDSISRHHRSGHGGTEAVNPKPVFVQSLFQSGIGHRFFEVNPSLSGIDWNSPYSVLASTILPSLSLPETDCVPVRERELRPFHRVTEWFQILEPVANNHDYRRQTIKLAEAPNSSKKDSEGGLHQIPILSRQYLVEAQKAANLYPVRKRLVPDSEEECVLLLFFTLV